MVSENWTKWIEKKWKYDVLWAGHLTHLTNVTQYSQKPLNQWQQNFHWKQHCHLLLKASRHSSMTRPRVCIWIIFHCKESKNGKSGNVFNLHNIIWINNVHSLKALHKRKQLCFLYIANAFMKWQTDILYFSCCNELPLRSVSQNTKQKNLNQNDIFLSNTFTQFLQ